MNVNSGSSGTIVGAEKRAPRGWTVTVKWDSGRLDNSWTEREFTDRPEARMNRLMPDGWKPNYGCIVKRCEALIKMIDNLDLKNPPFKWGHITEMRTQYKDRISIWRPFGKWVVSASFWGEERLHMEHEGDLLKPTFDELRSEVLDLLVTNMSNATTDAIIIESLKGIGQ